MPHPIVEIDELARLVIDELVKTSPPAAVSFALTCRALEEPTLKSLWKQQRSLTNLVRVLPGHTRVADEDDHEIIVSGRGFPVDWFRYQFLQVIEHDPSARDWARLRRYASWVHGLRLDYDRNITSDTLSRISSNTPGGILFPKLKQLFLVAHAARNALPFFPLFLSPQLKHVTLCTNFGLSEIPWNQSVAIVQIISSLPTSLEHLFVIAVEGKGGPVGDAISSFICRCGPSLRSVGTRVPLLEAPIHHLMQLPNLHYWTTVQPPPRIVPTFIFPSLEQLRLADPAALPWIQLLTSHGKHDLRGSSTSTTSHTNTTETLKSLECPSDTIVDSPFLASAAMFRNLVTLHVRTHCPATARCTFRLTDKDMENFATTLPRLKNLELGKPCHSNSCSTTIASLLSISTHCLELVSLETHFNTTTIVSDIQRLVDRGIGRDKAKCELRNLMVGFLPLVVSEEDTETVAMGLKVVFPRLMKMSCENERWCEVESKLGD